MNKIGPPKRCHRCFKLIQLGVDQHWYEYGSDRIHRCVLAVAAWMS